MHPITRIFKWSVLIGVLITLGCSRGNTGNPLPQEIQGLKLLKSTSGPEAAAMIARLHGKKVAPSENFIGHYGTGPNHIMLYVSRFKSKDKAQNLLNSMSKHIGKGSSGFVHHLTFDVDGNTIHIVLGQGQVNYFFRKGKNLYWLGIGADMARSGLAQLLKVDVEKIPTLNSLLSNSPERKS
ncbi:hypothetical protein BMS3Abin05_00811 [bacterium BMS3Abin05]|nr:hypothetical protein BMS3Abin05_00811 [bacterium BMS3Abin05]GBE28772.1 hypothetical protein BMS3Bbin03_02723 [bacterium BMS3Bbin03]